MHSKREYNFNVILNMCGTLACCTSKIPLVLLLCANTGQLDGKALAAPFNTRNVIIFSFNLRHRSLCAIHVVHWREEGSKATAHTHIVDDAS